MLVKLVKAVKHAPLSPAPDASFSSHFQVELFYQSGFPARRHLRALWLDEGRNMLDSSTKEGCHCQGKRSGGGEAAELDILEGVFSCRK